MIIQVDSSWMPKFAKCVDTHPYPLTYGKVYEIFTSPYSGHFKVKVDTGQIQHLLKTRFEELDTKDVELYI